MKELIAISQSPIGESSINTVNARDLHAFLGVGKDFSAWIKKQIERARLLENRDFISFTQKGEREIGGTTRIEYHLTLEAGKHIAMLSGTEKGFEVREYFIECEKVAKTATPSIQLPQTYKEALLQLVDQVEQNEQLQITLVEKQAKIEADLPKTIFADAVSASHTSILVGELAKLLKQNGIEIGQNRLFVWLRENGYLIKRHGADWNMPTQRSMDLKLFEVKERTINSPDGLIRITKTVKVSGKGQLYFINRFLSEIKEAA